MVSRGGKCASDSSTRCSSGDPLVFGRLSCAVLGFACVVCGTNDDDVVKRDEALSTFHTPSLLSSPPFFPPPSSCRAATWFLEEIIAPHRDLVPFCARPRYSLLSTPTPYFRKQPSVRLAFENTEFEKNSEGTEVK
eukprot:scaffold150490_cov29-Tisochrysis_lutea.AAC.3